MLVLVGVLGISRTDRHIVNARQVVRTIRTEPGAILIGDGIIMKFKKLHPGPS